jgi:hypothetical protein
MRMARKQILTAERVVIMDKLFRRNPSDDLGYELYLALRKAGLDNELAERIINDPSLAKKLVDTFKPSVTPASFNSQFHP